MKITFTEVCIFSMIITTAHTLLCITCEETNEDNITLSCTGSAEECSSTELCKSLDTFIYEHENSVKRVIKKGCGRPQLCGVYESFTASSYIIVTSIRCCSTDECTQPPPDLTRISNKTKNGVICPSCYSVNDNCDPNFSMECTGDQTHCVHFNEENVQSKNMKGCGTEKICRENEAFVNSPRFTRMSCTIENSTTSLPIGNFLWCSFCQINNGEMCTSEPYQCRPNYDVCLSERTRKQYDGSDSTELIRRCGTSNECNRDGTIRSSSKLIVMNTTCCDTNFCTPPTPILPPVSKNKNGLTCPACFVPNSDRCLGRDDLHCTGEENHCVKYVRTEVRDISSVTETLFGCSSDNICDAGSYTVTLPGNFKQEIRTNIMCNRANRSNKLDLILPGIVLMILSVIKLF